jgi:hypothetical protein
MGAEFFADFLFEALLSAEFDSRAPLCLGTGQPGTFQIVGAVLDMRAKLLLHLGVDLGTLKERGHAKTNRNPAVSYFLRLR